MSNQNTITIENNYNPTAPAKRLHASNADVIVCVGGMGSGKSFAVVKELEQSGLQWGGIPMAVYRKTMPALRDSTMHEFKEHADPNLGHMFAREDTWKYLNNSFVRFRGLDEASKAKSTEYAVIVMEEAEEFEEQDFRRLLERTRAKGAWSKCRLIIVLNPVDEEHWIYQTFVKKAHEFADAGIGLEVIHFSTYDNIENLPEGYIQKISVGLTPEEVERLIHGQWGTIIKGEAVYGKNLINPAVHFRVMDRFPGQILYRGWDFGFNRPAVSFRLVDQFGRKNIAHEMMGSKIDLPEYVPLVLQETQNKFGDQVKIFDYGDPRGHDRAPNGGESCFQVLQGFGINAIGERGSKEYVEKGIRQVKKELSTLIHGVPELTIDPSLNIIKQGYMGKYVRDDDGRPKKDGFYEHIMDADRYISHHSGMQNAVQEAMVNQRLKRQFHGQNRNRFTGYSRG